MGVCINTMGEKTPETDTHVLTHWGWTDHLPPLSQQPYIFTYHMNQHSFHGTICNIQQRATGSLIVRFCYNHPFHAHTYM